MGCTPHRQSAAIRKAVQNVFKETTAQQAVGCRPAQGEGAVVHVLNGTPDGNIKTISIADYLVQLGIDASVPPVNDGQADRNDYADTVITVYNGAEQDMPATVKVLQEAFKDTIVTADDPAQTPTSWSSSAQRHRRSSRHSDAPAAR